MSDPLRRRIVLGAAAVPPAAILAGCAGLGPAPAHVHYELEDAAPAAAARAAPAPGAASARTLLIAGVAGSAFYDGTGLAYSRAAGARAYYQFASWTERPSLRIARLLERRLAASGAFADVASATAPVRGDWLLELRLEQLYHDDAAPPGVARVEVVAELTDWAARRALGRRRFEQVEPLAAESAAQAVAACGRALSRLLDETQRWVLAQAGRPPG